MSSLWDSIREASPTWLGGTGGALTTTDQGQLIQDGIDQIEQVRTNADYFYGVGSDASNAASDAADYNESLIPGDVQAVALENAKANGECSLLSVVNGQADFFQCYPMAKWYALGIIILGVLYLAAPYVTILSSLRRKS